MKKRAFAFVTVLIVLFYLFSVSIAEDSTMIETELFMASLPGTWTRHVTSSGSIKYFKGIKEEGDYYYIQERSVPSILVQNLDEFYEGIIEGLEYSSIDGLQNVSYIEMFDAKCIRFEWNMIITGFKTFSFVIWKNDIFEMISYVYTSPSDYNKKSSEELSVLLESLIEKNS